MYSDVLQLHPTSCDPLWPNSHSAENFLPVILGPLPVAPDMQALEVRQLRRPALARIGNGARVGLFGITVLVKRRSRVFQRKTWRSRASMRAIAKCCVLEQFGVSTISVKSMLSIPSRYGRYRKVCASSYLYETARFESHEGIYVNEA